MWSWGFVEPTNMEVKLAINVCICGVEYPYQISFVSEIKPAQRQISLVLVYSHVSILRSL
jgi:hypothetical protein